MNDINAPSNKDLFAALVLAQSKCGYIQMTGKNREQGYSFASDEDIMKVVAPAMSEAGLVALPLTHTVTRAERQTARGGTMQVVDVTTEYLVAHTSGQSIVVQAVGCGQDTGDKAIYKAITGSLKYLYRAMFALPIGLDAEAATPEDRQGKPRETKDQKAARQAEHHPSWEKDQAGFMKTLVGDMKIAYDDFVEFLERGGAAPRPRPSMVDSKKRGEMLAWLRADGRDIVLEWLGKRDEQREVAGG